MPINKKVYDHVNDEEITTGNIPGEYQTPEGVPVMTNRPHSNVALDNLSDRRTSSIAGPPDDGSKYDENKPNDVSYSQYRADNQGWWAKLGTTLLGGTVSGFGTAVEQVGYMLDLADVFDRATGGVIDKDNIMSEAGAWIKRIATEEIPTYEHELPEGADLSDHLFRWSSFRGIIDSGVGFGLSGGVAGKIVGGVGKLARMSKAIDFAATRAPKIAKGIDQWSGALVRNLAEGKTMALEVYETQMEEFAPLIARGLITEEEAIKRASIDADKFQALNVLMIVSDKLSFDGIYKMKVAPGWGKKGFELGKIGGREYLEEGFQKVGQEVVQEYSNRDLNEDFDLANPAINRYNRGFASSSEEDRYDKQFSNYYNSTKGKEDIEKLRELYPNEDDYLDALDDNFVAKGKVGITTTHDDILNFSIKSFVKPETQTEAIMGLVSGPGQWLLTGSVGYSKGLKKEQEKYKKDKEFIEGAKKLLDDDIAALNARINANNVVASGPGARTVPLNSMDGTESTTPIQKANTDNAWGNLVFKAFENGTESQLKNLVEEKTKEGTANEKAKAKELLDDYNKIEKIYKSNIDYLNAGGDQGVINKKVELENYKRYKEAIKDDDNISDLVKQKVDSEIKILEGIIKTMTSVKTQKEIFEKLRPTIKAKRRINTLVRRNDTRKAYEEKIFGKQINKFNDVINKITDWFTFGDDTLKKQPTKSKDKPAVEVKDKTKKTVEERLDDGKASELVKESLTEIEKINKRLSQLNKIHSKTPKIQSQIDELEDSKSSIEKYISLAKETAEELIDLPDNEFEEVFNKVLYAKINGTKVPSVEEVKADNKKLNTIKKAKKKGFGKTAAKVVKSNSKKNINQVVLNNKPTKVNVKSKNGEGYIDGTLVKTKTATGKVAYKITSSDGVTIVENNQMGKGELSMNSSGELVYTFKPKSKNDSAPEFFLGNTDRINIISDKIVEAIETDNKADTKTPTEVVADEGDSKMIARLMTEYFDTGVFTLEIAQMIEKHRETLLGNTLYSTAVGDLDAVNNSLKFLLGLELGDAGIVSKELKAKIESYLDGIADDPIASLKLQLSLKGTKLYKLILIKMGEEIDIKPENNLTLLQFELEATLTELANGVDIMEVVDDILVAIRESLKESEIKGLRDIVQVIHDNVSDAHLDMLKNKFTIFRDAISQFDKSIVIDAVTFEEALSTNETQDIDEEVVTVVDETIEKVDHHTQVEIADAAKDDNSATIELASQEIGVVYTNRKSPEAASKVGYLARNYKVNGVLNADGTVIEITIEDLNDAIIWSPAMSLTTAVGDKVTLSVDTEYTGNIFDGTTNMKYSEFLELYKDDQEMLDSYLPISIKKGDQTLGHLHVPSFIHKSRAKGDLDLEMTKLNAIRKFIVENGAVDSEIDDKGRGVLIKLPKGEKVLLSEMGGDEVKVWVAGHSNIIKRGTETLDTEKHKERGMTYIEIQVTSKKVIIAPVDNNELTEQQLNTILAAMEIYRSKSKSSDLYKTVRTQSGQDLTTKVGLNNFLKKYVYMYTPKKTIKGNAARDKKIQDQAHKMMLANRPFFALDSKGKLYGLDSITSKSIKNARIQVNSLWLNKKDSFNVFEVTETGEIVDVNEGGTYENFIKHNTSTNLGGHRHVNEDGSVEFIHTIQNLVSFKTDFLNNKPNEDDEAANKKAPKKASAPKKKGKVTARKVDDAKAEKIAKMRAKMAELKNRDGISDAIKPQNDALSGKELEQKCKGGGKKAAKGAVIPKAAKGARSKSFTKGSEWSVTKDLSGHPSHARGGVNVLVGKGGVSFARKSGTVVKAANGLVVPATN